MDIKCAYKELVDVTALIKHPKNANKHEPRQIDLLARLMNFQGVRHPIIVSKRSGFIVAGHGRLDAAVKNGWPQFPVDYQEFESEAQEWAFLVSDNTISELAETDLEFVKLEMLNFPELDLAMLAIPDFSVSAIESDMPDLSGEAPLCQQRTFILSNEQCDILDEAMAKAKANEDCVDEINKNQNGNILSAIIRKYVGS